MRPQQTMPEKCRILCLHGYRQNKDVFKSKMGSWRKALKSRAEFVFLDAPHLVELDGPSNGEGDDVEPGTSARAWWKWEDTDTAGRPSLSSHYTGWEQSLAVLMSQMVEHKPDGLLGFSQGATATALLLAHLSAINSPLMPRFAILVAGFFPMDARFAKILSERPLNIPLLAVMGETDQFVPLARSHQLINALQNQAVVLLHSGAHMMPTCSGDCKQSILNFLDGNKSEASISS
eukprot:jgi/Botrbrau1/23176/Bobra.0041s0027.1